MKKLAILLLFLFSLSGNSQNSLAKIEYGYAEEAFAKKNYKKTLKHIEEVKKLLGSTNARVMFLEIMAMNYSITDLRKMIKNDPTDKFFGLSTSDLDELSKLKTKAEIQSYYLNKVSSRKNSSISSPVKWFQELDALNNLCDLYVKNFENDVPLEKLKQVYEVKKGMTPIINNQKTILVTLVFLKEKKIKEALPYLKQLADLKLIPLDLISEYEKDYEISNYQNVVLEKIEEDMVLVKGNESIKDLYVAKYEMTYYVFRGIENSYMPTEKIKNQTKPFSRSGAEQLLTQLNKLTNKKYRLPTKEEWYWFATGGEKTTDKERGRNSQKAKNIRLYAVSLEDVRRKSKSPYFDWEFLDRNAGTKKPNELGLYDVWGNYSELTQNGAYGGSRFIKMKRFAKGEDYTKAFAINGEKGKYKKNLLSIRLVRDAE